ncbi:threonylcarbamoyl-AMP synthase [Patescibacteria group bacterium]|nr:threonylcarbamoyl-AMP synthase [Patescibacteria group bacterium]
MKKLELDKKNQKSAINLAVRILKNGGVIVYPTETAYGLGADFFNPRAIKKVYRIKGRNFKKPLSVIVSSFVMAKRIVKFNQKSLQLARKYWPGALTLILNVEFRISNQNRISNFEIKNSKLEIINYKTLGLRVSSNKLAMAIVRKFGRPITATSANISGRGECYSAAEIINQFKNKKHQPDLLIDAGALPKRKVSTVIKVSNGKVEVLRKGAIKFK